MCSEIRVIYPNHDLHPTTINAVLFKGLSHYIEETVHKQPPDVCLLFHQRMQYYSIGYYWIISNYAHTFALISHRNQSKLYARQCVCTCRMPADYSNRMHTLCTYTRMYVYINGDTDHKTLPAFRQSFNQTRTHLCKQTEVYLSIYTW